MVLSTAITTIRPMTSQVLDAPDDVEESPQRSPRTRPGLLSVWLFIVAGLVFAMVVVGGATRLTQSGLSMVEWDPVSGAIPPLSNSAWQEEFDAYRATPEFKHVNSEMTLSQFKGIFWWEFAHRLLGRVIGAALAVPFVWFLYRRAIPPGFARRLVVLVLLVGLQGAIGWWMVASGLVDRPDVAHERLALHLVTALILLSALIWVGLDLRTLDQYETADSTPGGEADVSPDASASTELGGKSFPLAVSFIVVLFAQFVLGAFVAGLNAGRIQNTWPTMNGSWIPHGINELSPVWSNAVDNPIAVQFLHRWFAVVVVVVSIALAWSLFRVGSTRLATVLEAVVLIQFTLGVLTLLHAVPVGLGIAHQAGGAALLVVAVISTHHVRPSGHARFEKRDPLAGALMDAPTRA